MSRFGLSSRIGRRAISRLIYRVYERRLTAQLRAGAVPAHIGIILDGNRRHGRQRGVTDPQEIYGLGAGKLDEVLDWCAEFGVAAVTLWVLSTQNFGRPAEQVSGILGAVESKVRALATDPEIHSRRVRVRAIGRLELLPPATVAAIRAAEAATGGYDGMTLTIAVAYGGHEEIVDAVRAVLTEELASGADLATAIGRITPAAIGGHVYLAGLPDPDLIIRTSGELRLSGFLLWQSAYSEFHFTDVNWPGFRKIDFMRALRAYQQRTRRFGA